VKDAELDLAWWGLWLQRKGALHALKSSDGERGSLELGTLFAVRAEQFLLARQNAEFSASRRTHGSLRQATSLLAACWALGWVNLADRYGDRLLAGALAGYFTDAHQSYRNCFPWFSLRLFADWRGTRVDEWPHNRFPAPELEAVLNHWRVANADGLSDVLLAVCDRHTYESLNWSDKADKRSDFVDDIYWGWPIEIHVVFRLREGLGLANPALNHPLLNTPLGRYQPPVPIPQDDLLDEVVKLAIDKVRGLANEL
jgi:hypothetical protein